MKIGCMLWRIGDILDLHDQIEWVKIHDFEEVSFWTIAGNPGVWQGFDVEGANEDNIERLKNALSGIKEVDLHAGIALDSKNQDSRRGTVQKLDPTFRLAKTIGASVMTIHPDVETRDFYGQTRIEALAKMLVELNVMANKYDVLVGIETAGKQMGDDLTLVEKLDLSRVGITIDTGHVQSHGLETLSRYGSWNKMIIEHRKKIFHLHIHDYNDQFDHIAIGRGYIDFHDIIKSLCQIQFAGSLCLEINPDRETPEAICESKDKIKNMIDKHKSTEE